MKFDPQKPFDHSQDKHQRRSIRLPDYDYSQPGVYFITIVAWRRECLFGEIKDGEMHLNDAGQIVWEVWNSLPARYPQIGLGAAVVMPNHFHGNIIIHETPVVGRVNPIGANPVGAIHELPQRDSHRVTDQKERRRMTLPLVVGYFKMNTAKRVNKILNSEGVPVWQRNYYEHIIRDEEEYSRIHNYIEANVANWVTDEENPLKMP